MMKKKPWINGKRNYYIQTKSREKSFWYNRHKRQLNFTSKKEIDNLKTKVEIGSIRAEIYILKMLTQ